MHYSTSFLTNSNFKARGRRWWISPGRSSRPPLELISGMISIPVLQNDRNNAEPGITHLVKGQSPEHTSSNTKPVQDNAPEGFEEAAECEDFIPEKFVSQTRPWQVNPAEGQAAKAALSHSPTYNLVQALPTEVKCSHFCFPKCTIPEYPIQSLLECQQNRMFYLSSRVSWNSSSTEQPVCV